MFEDEYRSMTVSASSAIIVVVVVVVVLMCACVRFAEQAAERGVSDDGRVGAAAPHRDPADRDRLRQEAAVRRRGEDAQGTCTHTHMHRTLETLIYGSRDSGEFISS